MRLYFSTLKDIAQRGPMIPACATHMFFTRSDVSAGPVEQVPDRVLRDRISITLLLSFYGRYKRSHVTGELPKPYFVYFWRNKRSGTRGCDVDRRDSDKKKLK